MSVFLGKYNQKIIYYTTMALSKYFYICVAWIISTGFTCAQTDVQKVFDVMLKTYSEASTYQDFGTVTTLLETKQNTIKTQLIFRTAYQRSTGQFRFAYLEEKRTRFTILDEKCHVSWSDGRSTKSYWTIGNRLSDHQQITESLAAAAGVSGTASRKIPGILLIEPIRAGWDIRSLNALQMMPNERIKDIDCYHVSGQVMQMNRKIQVDLWIDPKTYLIKKITEESGPMGDSITKSIHIFEYDAVINIPIPSKYLEFNYQDCLLEK